MTTSIRKRYLFKLSTNIVVAIFGLAAITFVPRALGPEAYGKFGFITSNFNSILQFLTLSVPAAYFTWISRKGHKENTDVATGLTLYWNVATIIFLACFINIATFGRWNQFLWPDIPVWILWAALAFIGISNIFRLLSYLADGKAQTVGLEIFRISQNSLRIICLIILFGLGLLNLASYFYLQIILMAIMVLGLFIWLSKINAYSLHYLDFRNYEKEKRQEFISFCKTYVKPIVFVSFIGIFFGIFDRWFLQWIGGAKEQGFYSLAFRVGSITLIFTSAMTPILSREFGFAFEKQDFNSLRRLFDRIRVFFFIAVAMGVFFSVQSGNIVKIIGGKQFENAVIPISIMVLSPIHQTLGQLSSSLLTVTGQTLLYSRINLFVLMLGFPMTYLFIAPEHLIVPGLSLGSTGLALKMVLAQVISTNIALYYNTRFLEISFRRWIGIQCVTILTLAVLAALSSMIAGSIDLSLLHSRFGLHATGSIEIFTSALNFLVSGLIFCALLILLILIYPAIAGLSKRDLTNLIKLKAFG